MEDSPHKLVKPFVCVCVYACRSVFRKRRKKMSFRGIFRRNDSIQENIKCDHLHPKCIGSFCGSLRFYTNNVYTIQISMDLYIITNDIILMYVTRKMEISFGNKGSETGLLVILKHRKLYNIVNLN